MDTDILIGIVLTAAALLIVIVLTLTSKRSIERIASDGCRTARQTLKDKKNGS